MASSDTKNYVDPDISFRCKLFMDPTTICEKEFCSKRHELPKDSGIFCKFEREGSCWWDTKRCPFKHVEHSVHADQPQAYRLVESMGSIMMRLTARVRNNRVHQVNN